ncbi:SNF2 family N-terminal domain-containing protein [Xylaria scruposa]|nr:SNF2 family N-terminal domain-containing protein [Xylaria scruposa]
MHFTLDVKFNTTTCTLRNARQRSLSQRVLDVLHNHEPSQVPPSENNPILPSAFYGVAFMPDRENFNDLNEVSIPGLKATLLPFQERAIQWLLMREQVKYSGTGPDGSLQLVTHPRSSELVLPLSFAALDDVNSQRYYMSDLYHIVTRDITPFRESENMLRGGILAEEMGLGKTVEIISLILAHKRGAYPATDLDTYTNKVVHPTGATLIVTPETLQNQWVSEFKKHAPDLFVMKYPGIKVWANNKALNTEEEGESLANRFISELTDYVDVVITTYSVLQTELHYAIAPPERSMRYEKRHKRHTSPLVQIGWWRICLDEAQQIDSGVSSAAKVACLIPRVNAWAVTGTPVKDDPNDLWGLLQFLRYEPFHVYQLAWKALLTTHKTLFGELFHRIAIRHCKKAVRDELRLPLQKRCLVTMPFTAIEEHHYQTHFRALMEKAGLAEQGTPLNVDWDPDDPLVIEFMKKALACLRQTILHPELGLNERARVIVAYKTLAEHLETMIEHCEASIKSHQRSRLVAKLSRGQLLENSPRVTEALKIWEEVLEEVDPIVHEAREELQRALENALQEQTKGTSISDDQEPTDEEALETAKVGECRRKLRQFLDLQHRAKFFIASAFFQIKIDKNLTQPGSDEFRRLEQREVEGYESAQEIRRELLQDPLTRASKLMQKIQERAKTQSFVEIPEIVTSDIHGIESGQIAANLKILGASLNEQADVIDFLREHVIQLLLKPLVDAENEDETTGEEYDDSTKVQDHLMVYSLVLGAIIGDRQKALTGLTNELIRHETAAAESMARRGEGHAPQKLLELLEIRREAEPQPDETYLRGIIGQLKELSTGLRHDASRGSSRARVELQIVTTQLKATQKILTTHTKVVKSLERDLDFFTSAMNARVDFYRQLQSISDNVGPLAPEISTAFDASWGNYLVQEADLRRKTEHWRSNRRHLINLRERANDPCAICQSDDFMVGAITSCGHTFCKECIVHWLRSKRNCPLCKSYQDLNTLSEFNNKAQPVTKQLPCLKLVRERGHKGPGLYSNIDEDEKLAIQNIVLDGPSYSTKVDTLVKHLIWLQEEDPGAKSIIFTQFRTFFRILEQALTEHNIRFSTFARSGNRSLEIEKFKNDPTVACLLMDAKAHSSGLNLVNASHVFFCEPLLNTALELQAIARVDRIGQEHETTVWLYVVENTVEENIHALSERRRLEHIGEDDPKGKGKEITEEGLEDSALEAANSRELEQSKWSRLMDKSDEGETVDKGDLWECLFGTAVQV